jgi:hypothetical protein
VLAAVRKVREKEEVEGMKKVTWSTKQGSS